MRDRLRNEARALEILDGTGVAPGLVSVFEQEADVFIAEEDLGGRNLRSWVAAGMRDGLVTRPFDQTRRVLHDVAKLVALAHGRGVILRDLSPNNVIVTDDDHIVLIDLELALLSDGDRDWLRPQRYSRLYGTRAA